MLPILEDYLLLWMAGVTMMMIVTTCGKKEKPNGSININIKAKSIDKLPQLPLPAAPVGDEPKEVQLRSAKLPEKPEFENGKPPSVAEGKEGSKKDDDKKEEKREEMKLAVYPSVKEPTKSKRKKREEEIENEKREKIAQGYFQTRSDEDDTLEQVQSLAPEHSVRSKRITASVKNLNQPKTK